MSAREEDPQVNPLDLEIRNLPLSVRTSNCLRRSGLVTVDDVLCHTRAEILRLPNFGVGSWADLVATLRGLAPEGDPFLDRVDAFERGEKAATEPRPRVAPPAQAGAAPRPDQADAEPRPGPAEAAPEPDEEPALGPEILECMRQAVGDRKWLVLSGRFGLDGRVRTLEEVGGELGVTRERVRQIESQALAVLRKSPRVRRAAAGLAACVREAGGWMPLAEAAPNLPEGALRILARLAALEVLDPGFLAEPAGRLLQAKALAMVAEQDLPVPRRLEDVQEWLHHRLPDLPEDSLRRVPTQLWNCRILDGDVVATYGRAATRADWAAAVILRAGRPLGLRELAERFPDREMNEHAMAMVVAADDRFFLYDRGVYGLRRDLDLAPETWERWVQVLLEQLHQRRQVTTPRELLADLEALEPLPGWLNASSLFWLMRADPRFQSHRRLQVSPTGADLPDEQPVVQRRGRARASRGGRAPSLAQVLRGAGEPLTPAEARRRMSDAGRPLSQAAFEQLVQASDEVVEVDGRLTLSVSSQAAPAGEEDLVRWERQLRPRLAGLRLLGELELPRDEHLALGAVLQDFFGRVGFTPALHALQQRYPASLAAWLTFSGVFVYEYGTLWGPVFEGLSLPYDGNRSMALGRAFEAALRRLDLPDLGEPETGYRYLSNILGHGGIPDVSLPGFFRAVVMPSVRDPRFRELPASELGDTLTLHGLHKPARKFLQGGGRFAEDLVERCRDLARETLRLNRVPDGDFGLPERIVGAFRDWWASADSATTEAGSTVPRPALSLDPWGEGLRVVFPEARVAVPAGGRAVTVVWEVRSEGDVQEHAEECRVQGSHVLLPERALPLAGPARDYDCRVLVGRTVHGPFALPGFQRTRPVRFFEPGSGRVLPQRLGAGPVWAVYPEGRSLWLDGQPLEAMEVFPDLPGRWSDYRAEWVDLEGGRHVELRSGNTVEWSSSLSGRVRLELEGRPAVGAEAAESGIPVYVGRAPRLRLGVSDLAEWTLQVGVPGDVLVLWGQELEELAEPCEGGRSLDLEQVTGGVPGEYRILLRGTLGQDSRTAFRLVPALRLRPAGAPLRTSEPGAWLLTVPGECEVRARAERESPETQGDEARYRLLFRQDEMSLGVEVRYPTLEGEYALPLELCRPQVAWGLVGVEEGAGLRWQSAPGSVPLEVLEQAAGRAPHVLLHLPLEEAEVGLLVVEEGAPAQASPPVPVSRRTRFRGRLPLAPVLETLRSMRVATAHLLLEVRTPEETTCLHLLDVVRNWEPQALEASALRTLDLVQVQLRWRADFAARNRRVRLWSLARPWTLPLDRALDDAEEETAVLFLSRREMPPGPYQAELYLHDPWLPLDRHPRRPERTRPGNAVFVLGEDELAGSLEGLPDTALGHLERFLVSAEAGGFLLPEALALAKGARTQELPDLLRAYIRLSRDDRRTWPSVTTLRDDYLEKALTADLRELLGLLPTLELSGAEERELVLALVRLGITGATLPAEGLETGAREFLWRLWSPLGLLADLQTEDEEREARLERHLGRDWAAQVDREGNWGTPLGDEVHRSDEFLRAMWRALGVTPTAPMEPDFLQLANFETLRDLRRSRTEDEARAWVDAEALTLERELERLAASGAISGSTWRALLGRHPRHARGDQRDPLGTLPFVVGAVAFLQRLAARGTPTLGRSARTALAVSAWRLAPTLFARDLCHAELILGRTS